MTSTMQERTATTVALISSIRNPTLKNAYYLSTDCREELDRRVMETYVDDGTDGNITPAFRAMMFIAALNHLERKLGTRVEETRVEERAGASIMLCTAELGADERCHGAVVHSSCEEERSDARENRKLAAEDQRTLESSIHNGGTENIMPLLSKIAEDSDNASRKIIHTEPVLADMRPRQLSDNSTAERDIEVLENLERRSPSLFQTVGDRVSRRRSVVPSSLCRPEAIGLEEINEILENNVPNAEDRVASKPAMNEITVESITRTGGTDLIIPSSYTGAASASYRGTATGSATADVRSRHSSYVPDDESGIKDLDCMERRSPCVSEEVGNLVPRKRSDVPILLRKPHESRGSEDALNACDSLVKIAHQVSQDTVAISDAAILDTLGTGRSTNGGSTDGDVSSIQPRRAGLRNRARRVLRSLVDALESIPVVPSWLTFPTCSCFPARDGRMRFGRRREQAPNRSTPDPVRQSEA